MALDVADLPRGEPHLYGQMQGQGGQEYECEEVHICEIAAGRSLAFARIRLNCEWAARRPDAGSWHHLPTIWYGSTWK
jgi:hypothetical protein